ncbi:MAG TPA: hypothetical protein VGX76_07100, partial [Pirellulales bacterium]|nr:hypothetical protein [Pirellulales bacterium]
CGTCFCGLLAAAVGCGSGSGEHRHDPGSHGGFIVPLGADHYHAEVLFEPGGAFKLFMLNHDQTEVITVPVQELTAYVRSAGRAAAVQAKLVAEPRPGDPPAQTSLFVGTIPPELVGRQLVVVIPQIEIRGMRYRFGFTSEADENGPPMPVKVGDDIERELYLTPRGGYTQADIAANGGLMASQKYKGFHSAHDADPKPGDRICPITGTKANPECTWIVGGQEHQFCCPPCIDEFVKQAKTNPAEIKLPASYVKK